jgi:hypothetical protein
LSLQKVKTLYYTPQWCAFKFFFRKKRKEKIDTVKSVLRSHPWAKDKWPYMTDGRLGQIVLLGNVLQWDKNKVAA